MHRNTRDRKVVLIAGKHARAPKHPPDRGELLRGP